MSLDNLNCPTTATLSDLTGRTVIKEKVCFNQGQAQLSINKELPTGIYLLKIEGDAFVYTRKLNKVK